MKRVIVTFAVGKRYGKLLARKRAMLQEYAIKCNAKFQPICEVLDKNSNRPFLYQKLLIPKKFSDYDEVLYVDLDIYISSHCPIIFDVFSNGSGMAAVCDDRESSKYHMTWADYPDVLQETIADYFRNRNFQLNNKLKYTINGGILLFRPKAVGEIFEEYYYSDHNDGMKIGHEEPSMAYLAQTNSIFQSLDGRFNRQVIYEIKGTNNGSKVMQLENKIPNKIKSLYYRFGGFTFFPVPGYWKIVNEMIRGSWIVHFAGNYPIKF